MKKISFLLVFCFLVCCFPFFSCEKEREKICTYNITCEYSDHKIEGKEEFYFYNDTENAISTLKFNLFANAFRKDAVSTPYSNQYLSSAYYNGINYGGIEIISVKSCDKDLPFSICGEDKNVLSVELEKEIFPEEGEVITIDFITTLPNVIARMGVNAKTINVANFYPILCAYDKDGFYECLYYQNGDPFYSNVANYNVKLKVDKNFCLATCGKVNKYTENDTDAIFEINAENVRSFALVLSKDFESISCKCKNTDITYYYYNDKNPQKSLDAAVKSFSLYSDLYGEYPYETYSVVQTKFVFGGMEFPSIVFISDREEDMAYLEVIAHETAHQWFQSVVGNNEIEYGFLDEGLAEYSVVLFYENYPEYGYTRKALIDSAHKSYSVFCAIEDKLYNKVDTSMLRPLSEYKSEYEYVSVCYVKSCLMFDSLRTTIGDEKFFNGLKKYYEKYKFSNANPYDLMGVFEKIGADTNGFFNSFYDGKVIL